MVMVIGERSWDKALSGAMATPAFHELERFLAAERMAHKTIYPAEPQVFAALAHTPLRAVKVVILGQDPYHGAGQANGFSFSVPPGERQPPSLRNIFKELESDLGVKAPRHGDLTAWADQGVLLLNSVLTVEADHAGSHARKGWEAFTDTVLKTLSDQREGLVFLLWGSYAQIKGALIDRDKHLVLTSAHPSPLAAYRGFFGSKPFSKINAYLRERGEAEIDWELPAEN